MNNLQDPRKTCRSTIMNNNDSSYANLYTVRKQNTTIGPLPSKDNDGKVPAALQTNNLTYHVI